MAQEMLEITELFLDEALVVAEEGKTAMEVFLAALKGRTLSEATLQRFQPLINKKSVNWDDVVKEGDLLQVLPKIAGGR